MSIGQIIIMNKIIQQVNEYGSEKVKYLYDNMEPAIHKGDIICIIKYEFNELRENDIIVYYEDNTDHLYTGRIKSIINDEKCIELLVINDNIEYPNITRINQRSFIGIIKL